MINKHEYYLNKINTNKYLNTKSISEFEFIAIEKAYDNHIRNFILYYNCGGLKSMNVPSSEEIFLNEDIFLFVNENVNFNYRGLEYNAVYFSKQPIIVEHTLILYYDNIVDTKVLRISYFHTDEIIIDYTKNNFELIDEL